MVVSSSPVGGDQGRGSTVPSPRRSRRQVNKSRPTSLLRRQGPPRRLAGAEPPTCGSEGLGEDQRRHEQHIPVRSRSQGSSLDATDSRRIAKIILHLRIKSRLTQKQKCRIALSQATRLSHLVKETRGFPPPPHDGFGFVCMSDNCMMPVPCQAFFLLM